MHSRQRIETLYQYTAIDEYTRLRFWYGYEEQSIYSSAYFAKRAVKWFKRHGITVECLQTDNGFEFTKRFSPSKKDKKTMFENKLAELGIKHNLIPPYTPRKIIMHSYIMNLMNINNYESIPNSV